MESTNMAQKREKEETELKVPENLPICTPPQTITAPPPQLPAARPPETSDPKLSGAADLRTRTANTPEKSDLVSPAENRVTLKRPREVNRCSGSGCRKRIGLTGFRCRCGDMFCSEHRYSDRHDCSYDYKAAGREAIAKENPVVRAAKLLKWNFLLCNFCGCFKGIVNVAWLAGWGGERATKMERDRDYEFCRYGRRRLLAGVGCAGAWEMGGKEEAWQYRYLLKRWLRDKYETVGYLLMRNSTKASY
ncbi:hypothetical protein BUALT_Bualt02G0187200 [Buddleja alternifolia]|uniref:AN1-type domain-containing protein n=1 Tax=Buddleja alternifolia TaxID=168488 RepID=A0AAV6Y9C2_9LAMI|nr:hypothetical protein BUALT_Bualt02G0187200 [Buddleja alternifolia]